MYITASKLRKKWTDTTDSQTLEFCRQIENWGGRNIIYTDIKTDGALRGPNIEAVHKLLENISIPVIASGGITTLQDLEKLATLEPLGLEGVIIGKALYNSDIDLAEAIRLYQY